MIKLSFSPQTPKLTNSYFILKNSCDVRRFRASSYFRSQNLTKEPMYTVASGPAHSSLSRYCDNFLSISMLYPFKVFDFSSFSHLSCVNEMRCIRLRWRIRLRSDLYFRVEICDIFMIRARMPCIRL